MNSRGQHLALVTVLLKPVLQHASTHNPGGAVPLGPPVDLALDLDWFVTNQDRYPFFVGPNPLVDLR